MVGLEAYGMATATLHNFVLPSGWNFNVSPWFLQESAMQSGCPRMKPLQVSGMRAQFLFQSTP
jgi:hypothetical protein